MLLTRDKTKQVVEWAKGWEGFGDYLKLNALMAGQGEASVVTEVADYAVKEYIDGSADRVYLFSFKMVLPWSDGFDSTNQDSLEVAQQLYDWVVMQDEAERYPEWDDAVITSALPTYSMPKLNFVYEEDALAEYVIQVRIEYTE